MINYVHCHQNTPVVVKYIFGFFFVNSIVSIFLEPLIRCNKQHKPSHKQKLSTRTVHTNINIRTCLSSTAEIGLHGYIVLAEADYVL